MFFTLGSPLAWVCFKISDLFNFCNDTLTSFKNFGIFIGSKGSDTLMEGMSKSCWKSSMISSLMMISMSSWSLSRSVSGFGSLNNLNTWTFSLSKCLDLIWEVKVFQEAKIRWQSHFHFSLQCLSKICLDKCLFCPNSTWHVSHLCLIASWIVLTWITKLPLVLYSLPHLKHLCLIPEWMDFVCL